MRTFTLAPTLTLPMHRVLDASTIDRQDAIAWITSANVDTVRKACLLNILAVLSVTPQSAPLIAEVRAVFAVKVDRIYATMETSVRDTLFALVADPRMPFYHDARPVAIHRALLSAAGLPPDTPLDSFRAEGAPSLQIVVADSPFADTVADIDLDAHNPLQDVVGFAGHMVELLEGQRTGRPTDHLAMRATLGNGPARDCLCYTLGV